MTVKVDETIADMTAAGAFGPDSQLVSFELERRHTEQDQFASCVFYGTAAVDDRDGRRHSYRLVFKFKHPTPEMRALFKSDQQFHNEKLFYERIVPFLLAPDVDELATPTLCRYFYGRNDCGLLSHRDVIVLRNETDRGYRTAVTDHRLCLGFDHLIVALRTLGKFHGLSYRAKHVDPAKFTDNIAEVKETNWSEDGEWVLHNTVLRGLISVIVDRLNERCVKDGGDNNELEWVRRFQSELLAGLMRTLKDAVDPVEPLAVLCHGDFNRNNLLFRYDDSGRPVDALAYDMANVRYGSPAIDLSFFLYLNADRRIRDDHWDALMDTYCAALADAAGDVPVPGRDQLDAEMREHGFCGLAHVSYFARVVLDENNLMDTEEFVETVPSETLNYLLSKGGQPATEWIADAVQHFIRFKYAGTPDVVGGAPTKTRI